MDMAAMAMLKVQRTRKLMIGWMNTNQGPL